MVAVLVVVVVGAEAVEVPQRGGSGFFEGWLWSMSRLWVTWQPSMSHSGWSSSTAVRMRVGMVRPGCDTARTSVPSTRTSFTKESSSRRCATGTGMGPEPAISHTSPASVWPRTSAAWSMRTTVVTEREVSRDEVGALASATRASKASASERSRAPVVRACSKRSFSNGSMAERTRAVASTGPRMSMRPLPSGSVHAWRERAAWMRS